MCYPFLAAYSIKILTELVAISREEIHHHKCLLKISGKIVNNNYVTVRGILVITDLCRRRTYPPSDD